MLQNLLIDKATYKINITQIIKQFPKHSHMFFYANTNIKISRITYTPNVPVTHLCAANRRIVLVLANKSIVRVDQSKPDASMEIVDLSKTIGPKAKVQQAFLDPRGNHLILTLKSTGGFYILLSLRQYVLGGITFFDVKMLTT